MSDLISRSKVISVLEQLEEHSLSGKMDISNAIYLLENQPTTYDTSKVVEELETDSSVKLYGSGNSDNYLIPVKSAIEIVKQGGVSDDICEWEKHRIIDNVQMHKTSCLHEIEERFVKKYRYCPYCGKKIKVVE